MNMQDIKKLRDETGAGVVDVKNALEEFDGDTKKAKEVLMKKAAKRVEKRADRETGDGLVHAYIHGEGRTGSLVHLGCETDFVARTDDFKKLCHDVAMQVCTDEYENMEELLKSEFIKDPSKTISQLIEEVTAKTGEKVELKDFARFSVN